MGDPLAQFFACEIESDEEQKILSEAAGGRKRATTSRG
jgi:hypothetical protein